MSVSLGKILAPTAGKSRGGETFHIHHILNIQQQGLQSVVMVIKENKHKNKWNKKDDNRKMG